MWRSLIGAILVSTALVCIPEAYGGLHFEFDLHQENFRPDKLRLVVQTGHRRAVTSAMFLPDARQVLTLSADNTLCLWDLATAKKICGLDARTEHLDISRFSLIRFSPNCRQMLGVYGAERSDVQLWDWLTGRTLWYVNRGNVDLVEFSPDGRSIFIAGQDTTRLWDSATGKEIRRFEGPVGDVLSAAFSPDGRRVLAIGKDRTARLWDVATGKEIGHIHGLGDPVTAFYPDGRYVLTKSAQLWDLATAKITQRLFYGHFGRVSWISFSSDCRKMLTGGQDRTARLWDMAEGKELFCFDGHVGPVCSMSLSCDGDKLVTGSQDKTARLWDATSGEELRRFEGHGGSVHFVSISPDGQHVLSVDSDFVRLWETRTGNEVRRFPIAPYTVAGFSPDGRKLFLQGRDRIPRLYDVITAQELLRFPRQAEQIWSFTFSPAGQKLLTGSALGTVRLWDATTGKELRRFEGPVSEVLSAAFSPDGRHVLTGHEDKRARLWDVETGKEVRRFEGHAGRVSWVSFAPDGRQIVTGSRDRSHDHRHYHDGTARVWDTATGCQLRCLEPSYELAAVALNPDGRQVLTVAPDSTARVWDMATGKERQRFEWRADGVTSATFSPDGRRVITTHQDKTARLWDLATGKQIHRLEGYVDRIASSALSPSGRRLLLRICPNTVRLLDITTGKQVGVSTESDDEILCADLSPDGRQLLTAGTDKTVRLWDAGTGKEIRRFDGHGDCVYSAAFSPNGRYVVTGSGDETARLWDTSTGKELRRFDEKDRGGVMAVTYSPDGLYIATMTKDKGAVLWNVSTGKEIHRFVRPVRYQGVQWRSCFSVCFSPDGRKLLTSRCLETLSLRDVSTGLWDVRTGKEVWSFGWNAPVGRIKVQTGYVDGQSILRGPVVTAAGFSPDGDRVVTGTGDGLVTVRNASTGKPLAYGRFSECIHSVGFSPDGRKVLVGAWDNFVHVWNPTTYDPFDFRYGSGSNKELGRVITFNDGTWAVVDSASRYDASNGGDVEGLHWVIGNEPISLDQLKARYYDPGLLAKIMGFNKEPLRDVSAFENPKLHPAVELVEPTSENAPLGIRLTNRGGGIGRVIVKINGKELTADARGPNPDPNAEALFLEVPVADDPRLLPGEENTIEVQAYNAEGYLRSRGLVFKYTPLPDAELARPHLWAIVAGVSDYHGEKIDLRYAAKDAEDFAKAVQIAAGRFFGKDHVHLTVLSTERANADLRPTRANLVKAFEAARKAKPTDILVLYLAGHGINYGGQDGDFYYLTCNAGNFELVDPEVREQATLSSAELTELVKQIPALKQAMILDTCASGRFVQKLTEKRHIPSSQIRAMERVKDRTGMHVLAGCAADAVSYEATRYAQGLLTHSLLLGMRGAALREDQFVDVLPLFGFAADRVPELAGGIGGVQRPILASAKAGASFDIGQINSNDRARIPLQVTRPLILRSSLQEEEEYRDVLTLARRVDQELRDVSARGSQATLVFVDTSEFPDAYQLVGRYRVKGEKVVVYVNLFKAGTKLAKFTVTGDKNKLDGLAKRVVAEAERTLKSQPSRPTTK